MKITKRVLPLLMSAAVLGASACDGTGAPIPSQEATGDVQPQPAIAVRSDKARDTSPDVASGALAELASGNTDFALDLYAQLRDGDGNLFFSPYGISLALAMTYAGAAGDTLTAMASTLHFTLPEPEVHPAFNALDLALLSRSHGADGGQGAGLTLELANALWAQDGSSFLVPFLDTLAINYGAGMQLVDFGAPEAAAATINAWVAEHTGDKITDLVSPASLSAAVRLVLTNAVYFKAQWLKPFAEEVTSMRDFQLLDGSSVSVPVMSSLDNFRYATGDGFAAVELPYDGEETSMLVVLPDAGRFAEVEGGLDGAALAAIVDSLAYTQVSVSLPRFSFDAAFNLRGQLEALGMGSAFGDADFSRMDGTRSLAISDVVHKAFVAVNEDGTEAAAATAVLMVGTMPGGPEVDATRPFIFVIRDNVTGTVLFIGRVLNPL